MRIRYILTGMAFLAALFLSLDLAVAETVGNLSKSGDADLNKWCFDLGRSTDKDLSIRFGGFSPVMDMGISHRDRTPIYSDENAEARNWNETATRLSVRVPLNLAANTYSTALENDALTPITYALSYGRLNQMSAQELYPRWGQVIEVSYSHAAVRDDFKGSMFSVETTAFLPGLFRHHSLNIETGYERQKSGEYVLKSQLRPRGYSYEYHKNLYSASVNYSVPIASPNMSLGPVLNLERVKGNLFYDHAIGRGDGNNAVYNSVGAELSFDIDPSSLPITIELGMRFAYRLSDNEYQIEPVCFGLRF